MAKKIKRDKFYEAEQKMESSVRDFFEKNSTIIIGIVVAALLLIGIGYGYKQLIIGPKNIKAQTQMLKAQQYFEKDSFNLALNGDGVALGFKDIVSQFGGTSAGKGARLYAGISALHIGQYQEAIKYLDGFKSDDNLLNARKYGLLGDANAELDNMKAAADFYQKAVDANPANQISAPFYLYKLAKVQIINQENEKAKKNLQTIVEEFSNANEAAVAEKELGKLEANS
ncbi:MAG: hypothetical protein M9887_09690 [Chitinophagales bacterium]|nr:hypothetical protein [Chitinophagales bacterium]